MNNNAVVAADRLMAPNLRCGQSTRYGRRRRYSIACHVPHTSVRPAPVPRGGLINRFRAETRARVGSSGNHQGADRSVPRRKLADPSKTDHVGDRVSPRWPA